ncbi:hypothetical protein [Lacisediminihabitans profunda]|uniref:Uncharacterized protein n=1 Tax=Lacisediminihabitans profunda TaxID=2594790 RepID=A0A5C8UT62_9MICO|nr:hypothetical protein [Lacisediminihabitans profunda]TXN31123.1 hypothetical protein FVP33_05910 [Lacisediminihabitans profunda]
MTRDDRVVDDLLEEAAIDDAADLRSLLLELRSLGAGSPPEPSAELAALMTPAPVDIAAHRRVRNRRLIVAAIAVAASVGVGASAAAASPDFRHTAQTAISFLVHTLVPGALHEPGQPPVPAPGSSRVPGREGTSSGGPQRGASDKSSVSPSPRTSVPARPDPSRRPSTVVPPVTPPGAGSKPTAPPANSHH